MAVKNRIDHRLLTVRIHLQVGRSNSRIVLTGYRGIDKLMEVEAPPEAFGIRAELTPRAYGRAHFELPPSVSERIAAFVTRERTAPEPLWLQIDRSSGLLAVVPWERLLGPLAHAPLVRIPNFVVEPAPPTGSFTFAVCASSPAAKTPYPVDEQVTGVVAALSAAAPAARVHVFADQAAWPSIRERLGSGAVAHDPTEAAVLTPGRTGRMGPATAGIGSPWLLWMHSALQGERLAGIHFTCPGYFSGNRGALALAASPISNDDTAWSHFVGAEELESFLRLTGAWSLAASAPYESVWSVGLRLLLEELCWMRAGPLILQEAGPNHREELGMTYAFLLGDSPTPPASPNLSLRCHPRRLDAYATLQNQLEAPQDPARAVDDESTTAVLSLMESLVGPTREPAPVQPWRVSALQGLEKEISALPGCSEDELRGRADALRFLNDLMGEPRSEAVDKGPGIADYIERRGRGGVQ